MIRGALKPKKGIGGLGAWGLVKKNRRSPVRSPSSSPLTPHLSPVPDFRDYGRTEFINFIIEKKGYTHYLEIGCRDDACFKQVRCRSKVGIDPMSGGTHRMTSDEFFDACDSDDRSSLLIPQFEFDLIFIDGDHHHDQVAKDIRKSVRHLTERGMIVMHDVRPPTRLHENQDLCGTVWRAFVARARQSTLLDAVVLDMPADPVGLGVVLRRQNSAPIILHQANLEELDYDDMVRHQNDWLRLMPADQALRFAGVI